MIKTRSKYCSRLILILILSSITAVVASKEIPEINGWPVSFDGVIIDSIEVIRENVFDLDNPETNNFLFRMANKFHAVTREAVIKRELLLKEGDRYDTALVNESIRNLRSLPYLLNVNIFLRQGLNNEKVLTVITSDKWTTTGGFSIHRTGGRSDIQIGFKESNFLGYGIYTSHDFFILEGDRDYYQGEIVDHRFWNRKLSTGLFYTDNPRYGQASLNLGRPFFDLAQTWSVLTRFSYSHRRKDFYVSDTLMAQDHYKGGKVYLLNQWRLGPDYLKNYISLAYEYSNLKSRDRAYAVDTVGIDEILPPPPVDSALNYFEIGYRFQQINYTVFDRINRFQKPEDINLGLDISFYIGTAYDHKLERRFYRYYAYYPTYRLRIGSTLATFNYYYSLWQDDDRLLRRRTVWGIKGYHQFSPNHTFVAGIRYYSDILKDRPNIFYLDEETGLRGWDLYSFEGENRLIMNFEQRFFSDVEILSVNLGGVVFTDIGDIWYRDEKPSLGRMHASFGAGFRFGVSRSTNAEIIRFDLAYVPEIRRLQLSIGTGQYF